MAKHVAWGLQLDAGRAFRFSSPHQKSGVGHPLTQKREVSEQRDGEALAVPAKVSVGSMSLV